MTNEQLNVKYVDLQGLRLFAEELKKWLKSHVVETDIYKELLYRIENLELYKIVETLPEEGDEDTIYLLRNPNEEDKNHFIEYLYSKEHGWEEIGKFIPDIKLEEYLKIEDSPFEKGSAESSVVLKGGDNQTTNVNEAAFGRFNKSNENTKFSIGIGTSNTNRKNAVEVTDEGKVYIKGIGSYDGTNIGSSKDLSFAFNELPFIRRGPGNNAIKYGEDSIAGLYYAKIYLRGIDYANGKVYLSTDETADIVTSNFSEVYDTKIDLSPYLNNYVFFIYHDGTLGRSFVTKTKGNALYLNHLSSNRVLSNKIYTEEPIRFNGFLNSPDNTSAFQGCSAVSDNSHAEGLKTLALGYGSHTEGVVTIATNTAEHAEGRYNKSNEGTIHSVGIGKSSYDRKNAHEIMDDGKHYIYGIGGYDGTNPTTAKSVQEVINELVNKLNEITTSETN